MSIFHSPRKKVPNEYNILKVGNINIQRVECVRYLGILLDHHLNWISHVNFLSSKLTQTLSAFKLIKNLIPYKYRQQLYYGFCYSRIAYGIEVYGTASQRSIGKLQVIQNKILKILYNKDWYTPTVILHKDLMLLKICNIFSLFNLVFVYQQQNKELPEIFSSYYIARDNLHDRYTRNRKYLHINQSRNNYGDKSIKGYWS